MIQIPHEFIIKKLNDNTFNFFDLNTNFIYPLQIYMHLLFNAFLSRRLLTR